MAVCRLLCCLQWPRLMFHECCWQAVRVIESHWLRWQAMRLQTQAQAAACCVQAHWRRCRLHSRSSPHARLCQVLACIANLHIGIKPRCIDCLCHHFHAKQSSCADSLHARMHDGVASTTFCLSACLMYCKTQSARTQKALHAFLSCWPALLTNSLPWRDKWNECMHESRQHVDGTLLSPPLTSLHTRLVSAKEGSRAKTQPVRLPPGS